MAFIVPVKGGRFEIRESHSTPKGPRSRTLVSFTELTDEIVEKAQAKTEAPLDPEKLREAARRAGAPIARAPVDQATRELLAELGKGNQPEPRLRRLLATTLGANSTDVVSPPTPSHAMAEWMAATPEERGHALEDLLLFADALPSGGRKGKSLDFPRLDPGSA